MLAKRKVSNSQSRPGLSALEVTVVALACAPDVHAAGDPGGLEPLLDQDELYDARLDYKRAVAALRAGRSREVRRTAAKLADYPLKIYLDYYPAQGRVSTMGEIALQVTP